jgi:glyoxylase-like metal-dependent hydrolase (beta-lactamase superfamily II)
VKADGLRAVNVYMLRGDHGVSLIDAGDAQAASLDDLDDALRAAGVRLADVRSVFVTHVHLDHFTMASLIRRATGATIHLGTGERPALDSMVLLARGEREPHIRSDLHRVGAAALLEELEPHRIVPRVDANLWQSPDVWLDGDQTVTTESGALATIHTPGHTRGHIVYRDLARGGFFTGDHVLPHITPSIGFKSAPAATALTDYLCSLRAMLRFPDARLLPAHGPVAASTHARVRELLAHHDERLGATLDAVAASGSTPYHVASRLRWTSRHKPFDQLGAWHRYLATSETSVHLDTLVSRGALAHGVSSGTTKVFEPAATAGANR